MKILHYFLGFPPYRSGGLTKYAMDVMSEQVMRGEEVFALWPGRISVFSAEPNVKEHLTKTGIHSYELCNPLPVPLDEGIGKPEDFMLPCDGVAYRRFLDEIAPDVIHIHTLMGLHREFVEIASERGVRLIFTSHDYFGICPKVNLFRFNQVCVDDNCCADCAICCKKALSINTIRLLQSPLYRQIKESPLVKALRKKHRSTFFEENNQLTDEPVLEETAAKYRALREYYLGMLKRMYLIHFNSTVTRDVYCRYFTPQNAVVKSISHKNIQDNRKDSGWVPGDKLRLTMLSPAKPYKGYNEVKEVLDSLWKDGRRDFELRLFSPVINPSPYMIIRENGYHYDELRSILSQTDILLAPSVCYETFGFTVLEALSNGVPVIATDRMGSKDLVKDGGIILEAGNKYQLRDAVVALTPQIIREMRENIVNNVNITLWEQHITEIRAMYMDCEYT